MSARAADGSAGDTDYGRIGGGYRRYRRPEPEFATAIAEALGSARRVVNVGAGAGSYEPRDRAVTAVEPSASMRAQRPPELPAAIDAVAEHLPFGDGEFDAAMATFSIHQWSDIAAGLAELRRVTRGPVVLMTCAPDRLDRFWLNEYCPEVLAVEASRYPAVPAVAQALGGAVRVVDLPVPLGCADGFNEAYYGRPEQFLDPDARRANSAWSFVPTVAERRAMKALQHDLATGGVGPALRAPPHDAALRRVAGAHRPKWTVLSPVAAGLPEGGAKAASVRDNPPMTPLRWRTAGAVLLGAAGVLIVVALFTAFTPDVVRFANLTPNSGFRVLGDGVLRGAVPGAFAGVAFFLGLACFAAGAVAEARRQREDILRELTALRTRLGRDPGEGPAGPAAH